jgi:flagellar motor switch protein FliN
MPESPAPFGVHAEEAIDERRDVGESMGMEHENPEVEGKEMEQGIVTDRAASCDEAPSSKHPQGSPSLDLILDIPIEVSVELARMKMLTGDLLQLAEGSVIELNKWIGKPLDVLVNRRLIAQGETVVVNDHFGIRVTEIMSPVERVKRLGA